MPSIRFTASLYPALKENFLNGWLQQNKRQFICPGIKHRRRILFSLNLKRSEKGIQQSYTTYCLPSFSVSNVLYFQAKLTHSHSHSV